MPRALALFLAAVIALFALIQLVPYGHGHTNPPAGRLVAWDSPATQDLARRACYDCHSNETRWPWYASIAPISWRIQRHVTEGREKLNFTAFEPGSKEVSEAAGDAAETVTKGDMPPQDYLLAHPEARLSAADKQALVSGLRATVAAFGEREGTAAREHGEREGHGEEDEDRD